jgi:hypothetical protein
MTNEEFLELNYQLAELPSAQHRAGLASLVLMVKELKNQPWFEERENVILEFTELKEYSATLKLNLEGLKALFDFTFQASNEERWTTQKDKKKEYSDSEIRERELFNTEVLQNQGGKKMSSKIREYSEIIYRVCQSYVLGKLYSKYELSWNECKGNPKKEAEYSEKKNKIANEAFLAVRSRTEKQSFIDYFVSTLYPFIKKEEFAQFAEDLFSKTDEIRALTLLALASQFSSNKKLEQQKAESKAT